MKKNILFIGYGNGLLNLIKKFKTNKNINITGIILRTDLKRKEQNIFLKKIQKLKIKVLNIKKINSKELHKKLRLLNLDLICCWGFNELFNKNFIKVSKNGVINLHPGLLPKGRGSGAITGEILNNSKYLGYSSHLVDEKFDLGTIVNQIRFKFSGLEYYNEITTRIKKNIHLFYYNSIIDYLIKNKREKKIVDFGRYYPKLAPYDDYVDWNKKSLEIIKKVRSRSPSLLSKSIILRNNKIIYIRKINPTNIKNYKFVEGQVLDNSKQKGTLIKTRDNAVWLKSISYNKKNFFTPKFKIGTTFLSLNLSSLLEYINKIK